ncbi:hypothetical protein ABGB17_16615 [Sphaerisporangium sp. B11E5]|uniref:hypothetical protein n=1 Tax=Sphaerisporangium sp. B11E5 TaxID=3153563 RepID=UPI00325CE999
MEKTFTTPARGDVYELTVNVEMCWCATGTLSDETLRTKITARVPGVLAELKAAARPVARGFLPFRPDEAEGPVAAAILRAVNGELAATPDEDGVVLNCTPRVRVQMDPVIRDLQRPFVENQLKQEARYDLSELAARRLGDLRIVWRDFITAGLAEWETPYAVSLAQQPDLAFKLLFSMREDRREEARGLVGTVAQVASGHDRLDLLEFAVASDSALRRTYELLGLPLPTPGPDSLFGTAPNAEETP